MRNQVTSVGRQLDRLFRLGTVAGMTDAQLLEQFRSGDDESARLAFEAIVERHGPMVLRVCHAILHDAHAAEDAFQATFLVLARKARKIGSSELVGNWLYGVATRTARKAKSLAARRRAFDRRAASLSASVVEQRPHDPAQAELDRLLHEEIGRLPHSYRAAIVVCYLQGLSQTQAAVHLRLAESTVRGRLARARKLLGQRLVRRGVVPSAGLAALGHAAAEAAQFPGEMVKSTAQAALFLLNRGKATPCAVSATAHGIANGVLFTMWFSPLKTTVATVLVLAFAGAWLSVLAQRPATAYKPREQRRDDSSDDGANLGAPPRLAQVDRPEPVQRQAKRDQKETGTTLDPELVKLAPGPIVRSIPVSKDCMVLAYMPGWNFGNVDNIGIGNNDGGVRTLLDWPAVTAAEADSPERQFLLALYSRKTISHPPASVIHAFEVLSEWPERTSWKTLPRYDAEPAATFKFEPGDGWKLFDVTAIVRVRAKAAQKVHGILLRFLNEDVSDHTQEAFSDYKLVSREGAREWADRRPVLLVIKGQKPTTPP